MRTILILLACLLLAPVTAGCHRSADICDLICQCEDCTDREYDECIIDYDATEDISATYGCLDDYDRAYDCVMTKSNNCLNDNFAPDLDCADDINDVSECINDGSAL
jgi:hypothetical protein